MLFIETSLFTRWLPSYLDDTDYRRLQEYLLLNPAAGPVIPGSGGVRKVRWAPRHRGKRGALRVIYFWRHRHHEIWMLTLYKKSERATISAADLRRIAEAMRDE